MATITGTGTWVAKRAHQMTWTGLTSGDVGNGFKAPHMGDKSIQITGTIGASPVFAFQGSNDGTTWSTLKDPNGNLLDQTNTQFDGSGELETVLENTLFVRPNVTTGTSITFILISRESP